jgi:hypothetical protein
MLRGVIAMTCCVRGREVNTFGPGSLVWDTCAKRVDCISRGGGV